MDKPAKTTVTSKQNEEEDLEQELLKTAIKAKKLLEIANKTKQSDWWKNWNNEKK